MPLAKAGLYHTKPVGLSRYLSLVDVLSDYTDPCQGFEQILRQVVFANGRPGAHHVELGRFVIRSMNGVELNRDTWNFAVKERAHLTQAMVLSKDHNTAKGCPFADCRGSLQVNGIKWWVINLSCDFPWVILAYP